MDTPPYKPKIYLESSTDINTLDLWNQPDEGDPLVWLRRHRDELAKQYPTIELLSAYYRTMPSWDAIKTKLQKEIADENKSRHATR